MMNKFLAVVFGVVYVITAFLFNGFDLSFIYRLEEIRGQKMYPFFDKGGNDNNGDFQLNIRDTQPQINKQLNFLLPFYGFGFNYTWLSLHGYLSFSESPVQVHSVSIYNKRCKGDSDKLGFKESTSLWLHKWLSSI